MNLTMRQWGIFFAAISFAVLATVYISQYVFNMPPCHLCLMERVPYFIAFVLSLLVFFTRNKKVFLWLLSGVFVASFGLALFHFGVEQKWWTYASNCTATNLFKPGASVDEMMAALKQSPVVRCDQSVPFLFGIGMAFYNVLVSLGLASLALFAANRNGRYE